MKKFHESEMLNFLQISGANRYRANNCRKSREPTSRASLFLYVNKMDNFAG